MTTTDITRAGIDVNLLWSCFARAVAADTAARVGENRVDPADPRVAGFAAEVAAPMLEERGARIEIDRLNNVVATFGPLTGRELALVAYCTVHHGNEMSDPLTATRAPGPHGELWRGLGASQGKGGLAAICAAIDLLARCDVRLAGSVLAVVNSEGSSSHRSSEELYRHLQPLPAAAILAVGTGNRLSLGNRGRVDVVVEVGGIATHSSAPERGSNPIPMVGRVVERLGSTPIDDAQHPLLGCRTLAPYKLVCGPVAPHTIPARCELVLDRRLLPGDDPAQAVADVAAVLDGLPVAVAQGATMLPALVDEDEPAVVALQAGARSALGRELETFYPPYTFDAGYPCSLGVPAIMLGPATTDTGGADVLGDDVVSVDQLVDAAAVYAAAVPVLATALREQAGT